MGTSWSVIVVDKLADNVVTDLEAEIASELARINALMSTYDPDSQLSQLNRLEATYPVVLHKDVLAVVNAAMNISALTNGAYDVTLGPLIRLWGFGSKTNSAELPAPAQINELLSRSGYKYIELADNTLRKQYAGLEVDLSSIAKGYAVDKLGDLVAATGAKHFSVEIGGELLTRGNNANGQQWRIGIEQPDTTTKFGIAVNDAHIASSGSYRNYREVDGKRYSHLIDGRTGNPITHSTAAVTVLHSSTMLADAWATALMVLDFDSALELVEQQNIAALFTVKKPTGFELKPSRSFPMLITE
jgi:thiamine biosynthesis lipoprotein